ncbi:glutathione binding-like protein [Sphingomonas sp. PR090111-T3T-6A]|uniref:glutathione binding-like protein n=1 Tax=Sphingomonas sp. PR090111-T3T-6A TaxID=685778 RepID=UPI00037406D1|nr:glutathione binding-like protein [Sphingomonas sp. PR090111-T3T-6A]
MKLFIADQTCSQAVQIIANELGLQPELVHFDVFGKSTSNGEDFAAINPLLYVPALTLDADGKDILTETIIVASYLADQHPETGLTPKAGTLERAKFDQLLTFIATEIAQKHIPLMRKLMTEEGQLWTRNKLVSAYKVLDDRLATQEFVAGDAFTVADAYVWATMWHKRSGTEIEHLGNLMAWKARMDARPSVVKALKDEADVVNQHKAQLAA